MTTAPELDILYLSLSSSLSLSLSHTYTCVLLLSFLDENINDYVEARPRFGVYRDQRSSLLEKD